MPKKNVAQKMVESLCALLKSPEVQSSKKTMFLCRMGTFFPMHLPHVHGVVRFTSVCMSLLLLLFLFKRDDFSWSLDRCKAQALRETSVAQPPTKT